MAVCLQADEVGVNKEWREGKKERVPVEDSLSRVKLAECTNTWDEMVEARSRALGEQRGEGRKPQWSLWQ